jgi:S1-C subfamily serine protease
MSSIAASATMLGMLTQISNDFADAVAAAAPSVVQVQGRRRPATGLVYAEGVVVTTMRAVGRQDGVRVRTHSGDTLEATLAGWDPATSLAVLKVPGLTAAPFVPSATPVRVGHLALAVARSWSNAVTASAGVVAVIGGPLPTGRRRAIDQVIRTTAPMHEGFSGGAFLDASGALAGMTTAAAIRGFGVVIPAGIVWKTAAHILEHGGSARGYLGIVGQPVRLSDETGALLVTSVAPDGPAAKAGLLIGDVIVALDGAPVAAPEDLLDLLTGSRVGQTATLHLRRGGTPTDVSVTVGARP